MGELGLAPVRRVRIWIPGVQVSCNRQYPDLTSESGKSPRSKLTIKVQHLNRLAINLIQRPQRR